MAISGATLTKVNTALANLAAKVQAKQDAYFLAHGRYWQGILTPAVIPVDGTDTKPNLKLKPTDQVEDWTTLGLPATIPVSVEVHTHNGPQGHGYTAYVHAVVSGVHYVRAQGVGAHSTTFGWTDVTVEK